MAAGCARIVDAQVRQSATRAHGGRQILHVVCLLLPCLVASAGCREPARSVRGRVTLDGKPLSEALIHFVPLEAGNKRTGASIDNGQYEVADAVGLFPGTYRVEIVDNPPLELAHRSAHEVRATRRTRRVIPPEFGQGSPLTIEIGGQQPLDLQQLNFDLNTPSL